MAQLSRFLTKKEKEVTLATELSVLRAGDFVKDEIVSAIKEVDAVASGELLKSVTVDTMTSSSEFFTAYVSSSAEHAKFIEEGVRPGGRLPPVSRIYEWMIHRGLQPSISGAYAIARKIQERGLPAKKPFEKGVNRARPKIQKEVITVFDKTLTKD